MPDFGVCVRPEQGGLVPMVTLLAKELKAAKAKLEAEHKSKLKKLKDSQG